MPRLALAATVLFASLLPAQSTPMPLRGQLPAIGTVGDAPTTDTLTIEVHDDGTLTVGGLSLSYDELAGKVHDMAAALPGEPFGEWKPSRLNVLIRAAGSLPMGAVLQVLRTCLRDDTTVPRIFFGVRHVIDGSEGALAWFVPLEATRTPVEMPEHVPNHQTVLLRGDVDGDPCGLYQELTRLAQVMDEPTRENTYVLVDAPGNAQWSLVLGVFDAAARAALGVELGGKLTPEQQTCWETPSTRHDLRALVAAVPTLDRVGCRVGPATVFAAAVPAAPPRITGGFAGFSLLREVVEVMEPPPAPPSPSTAVAGAPTKHEVDGPTAAAIADGLRWLALHQDEDGRWDCDRFMKHDHAKVVSDGPGEAGHDIGVTGLALLALLADGNTIDNGAYKDNVERAVTWLSKQQQPNTGLIGQTIPNDYIYGHAIATLALTEAFGRSRDDTLRPTAQKAIHYLEMHRNPYAVWRYQPRDGDNDTAVTSWCLHAYSAARDFDLQVNAKAFELAEAWLDQITDSATGHHGYSKRGEPSARLPRDHARRFPPDLNEAMTGTGLFLRTLIGQSPKSDVCQKAADLVVQRLPEWTPDAGNIDYYAWYWCSLGLLQVGGEHWQKWQPAVTNALLAGQVKKGIAAGSWDPIDVWGAEGGRVYATAMATLTLQTGNRFTDTKR